MNDVHSGRGGQPASPGSSSEEILSGESLAARIRADSLETRLTRLSLLRAEHPGEDIEGLVAESGAEDLRKMAGSGGELYYFSALSMTEAYALHLFRVEEGDPVRLVAETVRDESRIYPRPTAAAQFAEAPFNLSARDVEELLGRMSLRPDLSDIDTCRASNGALYLYSKEHLAPALAASLAEWIEVGQKENP